MKSNITDEQLRQTPFGRFVNTQEDTADEADNIDADIPGYEPNVTVNTDIQEDDIIAQEEKPKRRFFSKRPKRERVFSEPEPEVQPIWTGQTTAIDIIAPSSVDNGSRDYVVVDGIYHAYLYIAGYGYRTHNEAAWLSSLVEAGDNIGISFSFKRMQRDKILSRIAQKTMINRSKMREVADTRSDFEELDSAISSGMYLKEGMNRGHQDFYYMSQFLK